MLGTGNNNDIDIMCTRQIRNSEVWRTVVPYCAHTAIIAPPPRAPRRLNNNTCLLYLVSAHRWHQHLLSSSAVPRVRADVDGSQSVSWCVCVFFFKASGREKRSCVEVQARGSEPKFILISDKTNGEDPGHVTHCCPRGSEISSLWQLVIGVY